MDTKINSNFFLSNECYRKLKRTEKKQASILLIITFILLCISLISITKNPISDSIIVILITLLCCYISRDYIKTGFFQKKPLRSDVSIIIDTRIRKRTNYCGTSNSKTHWTEYLVTISGTEVWARSLSSYKIPTPNFETGSSVIVFEESPNLFYVVSNE